jgi:DNA anti-recombination protein RmuC
MDLILLVSVISLFITSFFYIQFRRFVKKTTNEQERILSRTKKQADMIVDTAHTQEEELDESLTISRKRMVDAFEGQVEKDAKRIEKEMDKRLSEFTDRVFTKVDDHIAETLTRIDGELTQYKKQKMDAADEHVHRIIRSAATKSIANGLTLAVHEEIVERSLKEALNEIGL